MRLWERLAELRRERGYTLRDLRDRIEEKTGERLSISYLSELERTDTSPPIETLVRIARGYDLSLHNVLAPVDFYGGGTDARYPDALRELRESGSLDDEWMATLARIEFRGQRPQTKDEWLAIYAMLKAFLTSRPKG